MNEIPKFSPKNATNIPPFSLDDYINKSNQDTRKEYELYYSQLRRDINISVNKKEEYCVIVICKINGCENTEKEWESKVEFLQHKAIENFLYELSLKEYPYTYKFKCVDNSHDIYDKDVMMNYTIWKEIKIQLH